MSNFSEWWYGLTIALKIYWGLAIPFTLLFLVQVGRSFIGGGHTPDDTPDAEVDADTAVPLQFFTLKNLVAFFTIFCWTGIACTDGGLSPTTSLIIATVAGLLMMLVMTALFYFLSKASADGTMKIQKAVGNVGEVYLTIKKKREAMGQVQIKVQKTLRTLDAITDDDDDIPTGKMITVKSVLNNVLVVTAK